MFFSKVKCKVCTAQLHNILYFGFVCQFLCAFICLNVSVCNGVSLYSGCVKWFYSLGHITQYLELNFFSRLLRPALIASFLSQILQA